jgi:hypothetical protein
MTVRPTVESMLDQIAGLSHDQRDELLHALAEMHGRDLDVDEFDLGDAAR